MDHRWGARSISLLVLGLATGLGCGSSSSRPRIPDAERLVTVSHGVYGITTSQDDVGDQPVQPMGDFSILVYADVPPLSIGDNGLPIVTPAQAETRSDQSGFYQLELDGGRYVFCTSFLRCVWLDVPADQRLRLDYRADVGPGWSLGDPVQR
jgi:hypothetical protein